MQSEISEISPVLIEVKVEVPWDRVRKDLDAGFKKIARTAKIRGFRPGKAPTQVVKQLFGRQVMGEVTASLVEEGFLDAVQKHELQVVAQPEIEPPLIADGKPLAFTAKVEVRPKIDAVTTEGLKIYEDVGEVEDAAVDAEVEKLREEHAELRVPEPMRGAKAGDQLVIDYTVTIDGELKEEMGATDRGVELGAGRLLDAFETGLSGMQPGETKKVEVPFEDDHPNEELKGKTAEFEISVKELREKNLPELDDEFAKDCGEFETLLELRLDLRKKLEEQAKQRAEADQKDQLVEALIAANDVPVPPSMVQQQQQQMAYEFATFMQMAGGGAQMSPELFAGMKDRAEKRVKAGILLGALARQEDIDITADDLEAELQQIAEKSGKHIAKVRVDYKGERMEQLENSLLERKLMALLLARAEIVKGPKPEPEAPAAEDAESAETEKQGE